MVNGGQDTAPLMFFFGLGTLPSLLTLIFVSYKTKTFISANALRQIAGVVFIGLGIWTSAMALYHSSSHGGHQHNHSAVEHKAMTDACVFSRSHAPAWECKVV
jgi:sulfite exporter TauE/SafE